MYRCQRILYGLGMLRYNRQEHMRWCVRPRSALFAIAQGGWWKLEFCELRLTKISSSNRRSVIVHLTRCADSITVSVCYGRRNAADRLLAKAERSFHVRACGHPAPDFPKSVQPNTAFEITFSRLGQEAKTPREMSMEGIDR